MSKTYPELPETNFPDSLDVFDRLSDVTSGDIILVNQYQAYMSAGNQAAAAKLLTDNPDSKQNHQRVNHQQIFRRRFRAPENVQGGRTDLYRQPSRNCRSGGEALDRQTHRRHPLTVPGT